MDDLDDAVISIHVPRVEDDKKQQKNVNNLTISIHVPRVEDDNLVCGS